MPTYSEALFEPLEAWIEDVFGSLDPKDRGLFADEAKTLRLIVSKMLLEHTGRGSNPVIRLEQGRAELTVEEVETLREQLRSRLGGSS